MVFGPSETWLIHRQGQRMGRLLGGWGEKRARVSESLERGEQN